METVLTWLLEYATELVLAGCILFLNLIGKPKSAEKCRKLKKKNLTVLERKQIKNVEKMRQNQAKIEKLKEELNNA